jgi:hypothetical protein
VGGDPTNDPQRYQVLAGTSPGSLPPPGPDPRPSLVTGRDDDYRIVLSVGSLGGLEPGDSLAVRFALVLGTGLDGLLANAASAQLLHDGTLFDCDGNPETGANGEECRIPWTLRGTVPVAVSDLQAAADDEGIGLSWRLAFEPLAGLRAVHVERGTDAAGPYLELAVLEPAVVSTYRDAAVERRRTYWYRLVLETRDGARSASAPLSVAFETTGATRTGLARPVQLAPDAIQLGFRMGAPAPARLEIFDTRGRLLHQLALGVLGSGSYARVWDRRDESGQLVPRGVYFVRLQAGAVRSARKLVLASPPE